MIRAKLGHLHRWPALVHPRSPVLGQPTKRLPLAITLDSLPFRLQSSSNVSNGPHEKTAPAHAGPNTAPSRPVTARAEASMHAPKAERAPSSEHQGASQTRGKSGKDRPPSHDPSRVSHYKQRPPPPPIPVTEDWKLWKKRYARQVTVHRQIQRLPHRLDERPAPDAELRTVAGEPLKLVFNRWKVALKRARNHVMKFGPDLGIENEVLACHTIEDITAAWEKVPEAERTKEFINHMLQLARSDAEKAPLVIMALLPKTQPPPPYFVLEDMMRLTVRLAADAVEGSTGAARRNGMRLATSGVMSILRNTKPEYVRIDQVTLLRLIDLADIGDVVQLYRTLFNYGHTLSLNTMYQFASRLAAGPTMEARREALSVLRHLQRMGQTFNINSAEGLGVATLLLSDRSQNEVDFSPADLMQRLLRLGTRPERRTYTALMQSLAATGELRTAWMIYENMVEQGITLDAPVIHVMIAASAAANDIASLIQALRLPDSPRILGEYGWNLLLHTILYWRQPGIPPEVRHRKRFQLLMAAYSKVYDLGPLQELCKMDLGGYFFEDARDIDADIGEAVNSMSRLADAKLVPPSTTLRIMLVGYVRSLQQPVEVMSLCVHLDGLLKGRDPTVMSLVEGDKVAVYNAIILALILLPASRPAAYNVMRSLLQDNPSPSDSPETAPSASDADGLPRRPQPDRLTWTIILDAILLDANARYAKQQVEDHIRRMRAYGHELDQVAWNVLVRGFARMQDVNLTVQALRGMEDAGFDADQFTLQAFERLRDRERALAMMERFMERRKLEQWADPDARTANKAQRDGEGEEEEWQFDPAKAEFERMSKQLLNERARPKRAAAAAAAAAGGPRPQPQPQSREDDFDEQFRQRR